MSATSTPLYVHFEGLDLAGKTTATEGFVARSARAWAVRRNSIVPDNPIYLLADSLRKQDAYDAETLGNLFVAALMADLCAFERPMVDTIQDSTIVLRSLAYHTVRGTPRLPEVFLSLLQRHPRFDVSFVLTASIEARRERLASRRRESPDEVAPDDVLVESNPERFLAMERVLIATSRQWFGSVVIDTTYTSKSDVVDRIMALVPVQLS